MPTLVDLSSAPDPRDQLHETLQQLTGGANVGLPTETSYIAARLARGTAGLEKLRTACGDSSEPLTLVMASRESVLDFVSPVEGAAERLLRRCWPGPVVASMDVEPESGLFGRLDAEVRDAVIREGVARFWVPGHPLMREILRLLPAPLVVRTCGGNSLARTGQELIEQFGDVLETVLDDGPARFGQPATRVRISHDRWTVEQEGVVGETTLTRLASQLFVFVCTGNTCRSPMAEALFRKLLCESLDCEEDELAERGFVVASAGISARPGMPAAPEAVQLLARDRVDLSGHASQPLTEQLLLQADRIWTMTAGHRMAILGSYPHLTDRVQLLSEAGKDISDPIGGGMNEYTSCRNEILECIRQVMTSMAEPPNEAEES
ncbi:arsenate reductase/protein-tyrosine-phosphatase family protein [Maioricimonas rarisocia]|nr:Sua5/YciO/YrdC/YwlC family protein [Maioricimonas rarisocia]